MCNKICNARKECWDEGNIYGNPGPKLNRAVVSKAYQGMKEIGELIMNIGQKLDQLNFMEIDEFTPCETLKLLATFLRLSFNELNRNTTEVMDLLDMSLYLLNIRVTSR